MDTDTVRRAAVAHANEVLIWRGKPVKRGEMIQQMQREGVVSEDQLRELRSAESQRTKNERRSPRPQ